MANGEKMLYNLEQEEDLRRANAPREKCIRCKTAIHYLDLYDFGEELVCWDCLTDDEKTAVEEGNK